MEHEAGGNDLIKIPTAGIGQCDREVIGAILGSVVGTAFGSRIGSGSGKEPATIGGAIIGVLVGGSIGRTMDEADQNRVGQVLERKPNGTTVIWNNPDQNGQHKVTPMRTYQACIGAYCRE